MGPTRQGGNDSAIVSGHNGIRIQNQSPNRVKTEIRTVQAIDQAQAASSGQAVDHLH
jgi:hypothetical protein